MSVPITNNLSAPLSPAAIRQLSSTRQAAPTPTADPTAAAPADSFDTSALAGEANTLPGTRWTPGDGGGILQASNGLALRQDGSNFQLHVPGGDQIVWGADGRAIGVGAEGAFKVETHLDKDGVATGYSYRAKDGADVLINKNDMSVSYLKDGVTQSLDSEGGQFIAAQNKYQDRGTGKTSIIEQQVYIDPQGTVHNLKGNPDGLQVTRNQVSFKNPSNWKVSADLPRPLGFSPAGQFASQPALPKVTPQLQGLEMDRAQMAMGLRPLPQFDGQQPAAMPGVTPQMAAAQQAAAQMAASLNPMSASFGQTAAFNPNAFPGGLPAAAGAAPSQPVGAPDGGPNVQEGANQIIRTRTPDGSLSITTRNGITLMAQPNGQCYALDPRQANGSDALPVSVTPHQLPDGTTENQYTFNDALGGRYTMFDKSQDVYVQSGDNRVNQHIYPDGSIFMTVAGGQGTTFRAKVFPNGGMLEDPGLNIGKNLTSGDRDRATITYANGQTEKLGLPYPIPGDINYSTLPITGLSQQLDPIVQGQQPPPGVTPPEWNPAGAPSGWQQQQASTWGAPAYQNPTQWAPSPLPGQPIGY